MPPGGRKTISTIKQASDKAVTEAFQLATTTEIRRWARAGYVHRPHHLGIVVGLE